MAEFLDQRLPERFWSKCMPEPNSGCWLWFGARTKDYGTIVVNGRQAYAHRAAYEALVGLIPAGLEMDHLCRVSACVNPAHVEPVTHAENMRRSPILGRTKKTPSHCRHGHVLDGENTLFRRSRTGWICRQCSRISCARYDARRRAEKS